MKHAFIAPISLLSCIPESCDYHLVLAHLLHDSQYVEFYLQKARRGDFIILDNGAFENGLPMDLREIHDLCTKTSLIPNVIVLPDYPNQPAHKTRVASIDALSQYGSGGTTPLKWPNLAPPSYMAVPQSELGDWRGWIETYIHFTRFSNFDLRWIGLSILGIPNAFCDLTGTSDVAINRIFAISLLQNWPDRSSGNLWSNKHNHHALGLSQPREVLWMTLNGRIDGNDSSSAIWHGIHGITYDDSWGGLINGKINLPVDFSQTYEITNEQLENIRRNTSTIQKWCQSITI